MDAEFLSTAPFVSSPFSAVTLGAGLSPFQAARVPMVRRGTLLNWSDGLLTTHGLLDEPYDHHQDAPAYTAGSDLADDGADIKASSSRHIRSAAEELAYDLRSHAATDDAGDRVTDSS